MCKHGDTKDMRVWIAPEVSHDGKGRWDVKPVDSCLFDLVLALREAGLDTTGSCCGHGTGRGSIFLCDNRVLLLSTVAETVGRDELPKTDSSRYARLSPEERAALADQINAHGWASE